MASSHRNTKPDLNELELKSFHRPRMSAPLKARPWVISVNGERGKSSAAASARSLSGSNSTNIDLNVATGDFILVEYFEENPPILLNFGMASIVLNYERIRDAGADQDEKRHKSLQARTTEFENVYRLPRHVKLLMERREFKQIFEIESNSKLTVGEPYLLEPEDEFPFLGTLKSGEILQSLKNELFRSPIFEHKPRSTDFLLTRTKIGKDSLSYTIRAIQRLFLSGQTEPMDVVPKPSKLLNKTQENFLLLAAARFLMANPGGVEWKELRKDLIKSSYSKEKAIEALLGKVAEKGKFYDPDSQSRSGAISKYFPRPGLDIDELEKQFSAKDGTLTR